MSMDYKGLSCVRCKSYLFPEDDVVFCPECGAPHHRDCYEALGHCAVEELHGTEQEYSKERVQAAYKEAHCEEERAATHTPELVKCSMCGEMYDTKLNRCPKCGVPKFSNMGGFAQFDFLGGVPEDYDLGDGVTANEAKSFVMANTHRYIPKFAALNRKNKVSWNWLAFITPAGWMLSRKMYKSGIIAGILTVIATWLSYPLSVRLVELGVSGTGVGVNEMLSVVSQIAPVIIVMALIGMLFRLGISLFSAMLGDYIYKNHAIETIKAIKEKSDNKVEAFRKRGGVSLTAFLLGIMILNFVTNLIAMF